MNDEYRQQALDNFRNALGRLEQSDFEVQYRQGENGLGIWIEQAILEPDQGKRVEYTISNHTLRLKPKK